MTPTPRLAEERSPTRTMRLIERRIKKQLAELSKNAAAGEPVDSAEVDLLERLLRLLELQATLRARRWRYGMIAVGGILAMLLGIAAFRPVDVVEVDGAVYASAVTLTLPSSQQVLPFDDGIQEFAATGFLSNAFDAGSPARAVRTPPSAFSAKRADGGSITLQQATVPGGARITLRRENPARVLLQVDPRVRLPGGSVLLTLAGRARLSSDLGEVADAFGPGTPLELNFGPDQFHLSFTPVDSAVELLRAVQVVSLAFTEAEDATADLESKLEVLSTITGGKLVLPALNGQTIALRAREDVRLVPEELRINRVSLAPGGLLVEFQARASELALGPEERRRNLKPSVLQAYAASKPLEIARVTFFSALTLLVTALAWWNRSH